ncbi:MAG: outer rane lipoprotein [Deltaproteobacteria bacterium]|nr:outer rane lipoprotein [Deltaproteobacteria bacterium]
MRRANRAAALRSANYVLSLWLFFNPAMARADWACVPGETSCKTVFIVHNSWHAAIVLSRGDLGLDVLPELSDFPGAEFIEFSWGDKDYFPDPNSGYFAAIKAALWSSGSVIHLVGFNGSMEQFYRGADIIELRLTLAAFSRLLENLGQTFARGQTIGRAPASPGLFPDSRFYPATPTFSLLRTCNTWVAEILESAGVPVSPRMVITAGNLASQLAPLALRRR